MQRRGKVDKDGNLVKKGNSSEKKINGKLVYYRKIASIKRN